LPATALFLTLVSFATTIKKPCHWGAGFLWGVAGIIGAKTWGLPGVSVLGRLPLFERMNFPRYAAFLLTFACAGLAAVGVSAVAKFEARQWRLWLGVWFVLIVTLFALSLRPVWPTVQQSVVNSLPVHTLVVFGALGLAWAVVGPIGLWWLTCRRSHEPQPLYFVAALGILLQGAAYAPSGYVWQTYAILSAVSLGLYAIVVLLIGLVPTLRPGRLLVMVGCLCVALPSLGAALFVSSGLAARYNPLTPPPFLNWLMRLQRPNLYRSYSLNFALQANFAAPFAITSLNNLEAIALADTAAFVLRYLDRGQSPLMFLAFGAPGALMEYWHNNKRYFDLIGVKYLITQGSNPRPVLYDTEAFGARKEVAPLSKPVEMSIVCPADTLSTISVLLGTYGRKNPGTVTLSIFSDDGVLLRQQAIEAASLLDVAFQEFQFPPLPGLKGQSLRLRLEFAPSQADSLIATWIYPDQPVLGFALRVIDPQRELTLLYEDSDSQVRVWDNPTAGPRVFLAPKATVAAAGQEALARLQDTPDLTRQVWIEQGLEMATTWPEAQPPGELLSFSLAPNSVKVQYQARTPGILTLTDSYAEGWRATLNGREVPVLRVDGVFRGIRIEEPGTQEVQFWYRPPYWTLSLGMAGVGFLMVIGASLLDRRRLVE
ncbi:MAG: YfhO family protein, partial [Deltaproteobacteria bacterium]|nr:YfhO family protein [Deltaproteobacteria bacterium]